MMTKKIKTYCPSHILLAAAFVVSLIFSFPAESAASTCTLSSDLINPSYVGVGLGNSLPFFGSGTFKLYISCPSGQAWNVNYAENAKTLYPTMNGKNIALTICKTDQVCSASDITVGDIIGVGVGTGFPQLVASLYYGVSAATVSPTACTTDSGAWVCATSGLAYTTISTMFTSAAGGNLQVIPSITLVDGCVFTSGANNSVNFDGLHDVSGLFFNKTYVCTKSNTVSIDGGLHPAGNLRQAAYGNNFIKYHLYSDSGYSSEIGAVSNNTFNTGCTSCNLNIFGKITAGENGGGPGVLGTYTDTVTVQVNF